MIFQTPKPIHLCGGVVNTNPCRICRDTKEPRGRDTILGNPTGAATRQPKGFIGVMKNNVKPRKSTRNSNLNPVSVTGSTLRRRAFAWHLDAAARRTACNVIFREVSGGKKGKCTAPLLDWLSANEWLGMRILLGHIANRSFSSGLDEAAIFNKINLRAEKPLMAPLRDGRHLNNFLACMATRRMLDLVRQSWRIVMVEDCEEGDATCVHKFNSLSQACDAVVHREEQIIISHLVNISSRAKGKDLAAEVFAHYVEHYDTVTQAELAKVFKITQCKVNRILNKKREELREAVERELGITVQVKTRKPRPCKIRKEAATAAVEPHQPTLDVG